jgi:flagellar motility protein MotE (MotC chaperone)
MIQSKDIMTGANEAMKPVGDLVKIYTAMKPKQAAGILNQMDMAILKEIIKRMAKKKVAPIMAAMDAKKAKDLSQILAKESQNIS